MIRDYVIRADGEVSGDVTVTAFGSSLTKRAEWPQALGQALGDCGPVAVSVEVVGEAGANSDNGRGRVASYAALRMDVAILEYAINDADLVDGLSRAESIANYRAMIANLRVAHPDIAIVLLATNPVRGIQRLKRPKLMGYYDALEDLARSEEVSFFDGAARWAMSDPGGMGLTDGLHPDPKAEAALYLPDLSNLVAATLGLPCRD